MFNPADAGPGTHNITYEVTDPVAVCTASANVSVVVYPSPIQDFIPSIDTVCIGETLSIGFDDTDGLTYSWEFGVDNSSPNVNDTDFNLSYSSAGDKRIVMTVASGPDCEYTIDHDVYVRPPLVFPGVFCGGLSPVSVGFEWDPLAGVVEFDYEVLINGEVSETGTLTETEIMIDGLSEGDMVDINVTAIDLNGCSNPIQTQTCIAQNCPEFDITLTATETLLCWEPGIVIQLDQTTLNDGVDAIGTGEWSGSDLVDADTGEFIPDGPGSYVLSYVFAQDGTACPGSESITIDILDAAESDFTQDLEQVCLGEEVTFTLEANYNPAYTYDWTSDLPEADWDINDNLDGTFTLQFFEQGFSVGNSGMFNLMTSIAGCESPITTVEVEVGVVPELPVVSCEEDLGYILFEWNAVDCVEEYLIYQDGDLIGSQSETEYELIDLDPNQTVEIEIEVVSNCICDFPSTLLLSCTAQDCDEAMITFDPSVVTEYCLSSLPVFTFTAEVEGDEIDNSGSFSWSGDGVDEAGNVDFTGFDSGMYNISVEYEEDDCFYSNSIMFEIYPNPEINVETFNAPCPGAEGSVNITGSGNGPFNIIADSPSFEVGQLTSGVNVLQAGNYTVLMTDDNGCEMEGVFTIGTDAEPVDDLRVEYQSIVNDSLNLFTYSTEQENIENVIWTINGELIADVDCATGDCFNLSYAAPSEGVYEICTYAYYDGANCELVECRSYNVFEIEFNSYYIPNVITPDNDEDPVNKFLTIFVEGDEVTVMSIGIFDRWGNRVFFNDETQVVAGDEEAILWDGKFEQGKDFIPGVYIYLIESEIDGYTEWITDDITVLK